MTQLRRTATGVALSVPEILSLVFSYGSPQTQAACACVCRKWSEVALDELWRDVEDIYPILKLLIPFESQHDGYAWDEARYEQQMSNLLQDVDWPRFRQYASRVKSITYDERAIEKVPPSNEAMAFLLMQHPYGNCLTPNVRTLRWTLYFGPITPMIPFISQFLEEIRVESNFESTETREVFFRLTHRTPTLKRLSIGSKLSPSEIPSSFAGWIRTCTSLEKAYIPRGWQTTSVVNAFGSLPNLLELGVEWNPVPEEYMELGMEMKLVQGHFRSLRRLGWCSEIKDATDLLQQTSCGLQGLTLDCPGYPSQVEVAAFIAAAAHRCPDLDSFCLNLARLMERDEDTPELLDLEILRPLLTCKRLKDLRIHYPGPCILSTSILKEMGAAWPNMEELVLCPDPDGLVDDQGTPISMLPHVATAFPRIRLLGLYLDHLDPPGFAGNLLPKIQFRDLRELNVGTSRVPSGDTAAVGLYLASLFAVGTRPSIKAEESEARRDCYSSFVASENWGVIERLVHRTMRVKEAVFCSLSDRRCLEMEQL